MQALRGKRRCSPRQPRLARKRPGRPSKPCEAIRQPEPSGILFPNGLGLLAFLLSKGPEGRRSVGMCMTRIRYSVRNRRACTLLCMQQEGNLNLLVCICVCQWFCVLHCIKSCMLYVSCLGCVGVARAGIVNSLRALVTLNLYPLIESAGREMSLQQHRCLDDSI